MVQVLLYNNTMILIHPEYRHCYFEGWDARMSNLYVNPYVLDFESDKYHAWKHGWEDCDIELQSDEDNNGYGHV